MSDKYDQEIAEILNEDDFREAVLDHWYSGSPLFQIIAPKNYSHLAGAAACGCLTQIRKGSAVKYNGTFEYIATRDGKTRDPLTDEIRADLRLPSDETFITAEHLEVFAEWQRRIDKEWGREP